LKASIIGFDQGLSQAISGLDVAVGEAPLGTKVAFVDDGISDAVDAEDIVVILIDFNGNLATYPAITTGRSDGFLVCADFERITIGLITVSDGIGGANVRTCTAGDTWTAGKGIGLSKGNSLVRASTGYAKHKLPLNLLAGVEAKSAVDTG
jgi:hypothetical protein